MAAMALAVSSWPLSQWDLQSRGVCGLSWDHMPITGPCTVARETHMSAARRGVPTAALAAEDQARRPQSCRQKGGSGNREGNGWQQTHRAAPPTKKDPLPPDVHVPCASARRPHPSPRSLPSPAHCLHLNTLQSDLTEPPMADLDPKAKFQTSFNLDLLVMISVVLH